MFSAFVLNKKKFTMHHILLPFKISFKSLLSVLVKSLEISFCLLCRCDVAQSFLISFLINLVLSLTFSLQACLKYNPGSISCKYWKGVSHAALGNFFESVKSSTQVCDKNCSRCKKSFYKKQARIQHR